MTGSAVTAAALALPIEDRSRLLAGWTRCARLRYLEFHSGPHGFGMRLKPQSMPLATGIHVHLGLADILRRVSSSGLPLDASELRAGWREDISQAAARYAKAVKARGFLELAQAPEGTEYTPEYVLGEQCALVEGLLWGFVRVVLPTLLDEFDIIAIEEEAELVAGCTCGLGEVNGHDLHVARKCEGVVVPTRADILLRRKIDGALMNWDFKTSSDIQSKEWLQQWEDNPQLALNSLGAERQHGEPIDFCYILGLDKGYRARTKGPEDTGRRKTGPKRQESVLCYAWHRPGNPPFFDPAWATSWNYVDEQGKNRTLQGKGYTSRSVWDAPPDAFPGKPADWSVMEYWTYWLPEEELRPLYIMHGPLQTPRHLLPALLRAIHAEGWRWGEKLYRLYKLRQEIEAGHPGIPWAEAHPELEEALDELAPQSWDCYRWKKWCQFVWVCKKRLGWENPLGVGQGGERFEIRRPHHAIELERMKVSGVEPPPEQWEEETE